MQWLEPEGHGPALAGLWRAARAGRLAHALLFEGRPGIGKFAAAVWFAAGLLCREGPGRPCGVCPGCKQIRSGGWRGGHPDMLRIDPLEEGWEEIPVAAIAERRGEGNGPAECLATFLMLRPREGNTRLVLVRESERMNAAAQNALLKTLEEPSLGTVLVLETSRPQDLLPTIRSRVVRLALEPPPREVCARVLGEAGSAPEDAALLEVLAEGSPGEALRLARQGALAARLSLLELVRGERDPLAVAGGWLALEGDFGQGTPLRLARRRGRLALDLALWALGEARRGSAGGGAPREEFAARLEQGGEGRLAALGERLLRARRDLDLNLDPGAVLELAALELAPAGAGRVAGRAAGAHNSPAGNAP